jgi:hypothetical protein
MTRLQAVMFALSDMMTHVEIGVALARKAFCLTRGNDAQAEKFRIISRVFAGEVVQIVGENALMIFLGASEADQSAVDQFMADIAYHGMLGSLAKRVVDMDRIADFIFER